MGQDFNDSQLWEGQQRLTLCIESTPIHCIHLLISFGDPAALGEHAYSSTAAQCTGLELLVVELQQLTSLVRNQALGKSLCITSTIPCTISAIIFSMLLGLDPAGVGMQHVIRYQGSSGPIPKTRQDTWRLGSCEVQTATVKTY